MIAALVAVPTDAKIIETSSPSTSRRACSTDLRWRIGIVIGDKFDLSAIYAALLVEHPEKGGLGLSDCRDNCERPAIRHDIPDRDFRCAGARSVLRIRSG